MSSADPHDEIMRDHAQELYMALEILLAVTVHVEGTAAYHARVIARRVLAKAHGVREFGEIDPVSQAFADALADRFPKAAAGGLGQ